MKVALIVPHASAKIISGVIMSALPSPRQTLSFGGGFGIVVMAWLSSISLSSFRANPVTCSLDNAGFYCEFPNRLAFRNGLRTQAVEKSGLVLVKHLDGIDLQHQRTSDLDESLPIIEDPQRPLHCQASPCHAKPSLAAP